MSRSPRDVILTDGHGRPLDRPEPEQFDSTLAFIRALHAYNDRVTDLANSSFAEAFSAALRQK